MIRHLMAVAFLSTLAGQASAVDISSCHVTVPPGEVGELQTDLSCTGAFVVALDRGATLDLNGHVVKLQALPGLQQAVVRCEARRCTVGGPGTIACTGGPGQYVSGIGMSLGGRLNVQDVTITGCDQGVWDMGTPSAKTRVFATDVNVNHCTDNGIEAEKLVGTNVQANDNGFAGLAVEQVIGTNLTVNDNGALNSISGITSFQGTVRVTGLTATGNLRNGVEAKKVVLTSSTVINNQNRDIVSARFPRLTNVVCGTSNNWGVCQND